MLSVVVAVALSTDDDCRMGRSVEGLYSPLSLRGCADSVEVFTVASDDTLLAKSEVE